MCVYVRCISEEYKYKCSLSATKPKDSRYKCHANRMPRYAPNNARDVTKVFYSSTRPAKQPRRTMLRHGWLHGLLRGAALLVEVACGLPVSFSTQSIRASPVSFSPRSRSWS